MLLVGVGVGVCHRPYWVIKGNNAIKYKDIRNIMPIINQASGVSTSLDELSL